MTPERLEEIAVELESYGPASDGAVHLDLDDEFFQGNRAGLLHLAAALLRSVRGPGAVDLPIEVISYDGSIRLNAVSCDNVLTAPPEESLAEKVANNFLKVGCICVVLCFILAVADFFYRLNVYLAIFAVALAASCVLALKVNSVLRRKRMKQWSASIKS